MFFPKCMYANIPCNDFNRWHLRLGHPNDIVMNHLPFAISQKNIAHDCYVCPMAKQTRKSFPKSYIQTKGIFELVHVDIRGPYHVSTITGANYFLTLVDDFSRATWTYLMTYKSQTCSILEGFLSLVHNQFNIFVKKIRSDNGTEFLSHSCQSLFSSLEILHDRSCPHTPQQNGVVERKHRHLLQITRALLFQSGLPSQFWGEALLYATYLVNRLPTKLLGWKTPFEILYSKQMDYNNIRTFGCLIFSTDV